MGKIEKTGIKTIKEMEAHLNKLDIGEKEARSEKYNGSMVTLTIEDGEYCSTKAGEIFLNRTLHQFGKALIFDDKKKMKLNNKYAGHTYVILTSNTSQVLYNTLKEIVETESPKPTELTKEDEEIINNYLDACRDFYEAVHTKIEEIIKERKATIDELLIKAMAANMRSIILHQIKATKENIYKLVHYSAPIDVDDKYYFNNFVGDEDIKRQYELAYNKLVSIVDKYD